MDYSEKVMLRKYGYIWVTAVLFVASILAQWATNEGGLKNFVNALAENWQSEFLQLIWQVLGLMFLLCWGSPTSREGQERLESKIDAIAQTVGVKDVSELPNEELFQDSAK
jgi:hypothetical protein